jgi:protein ImuB
MPIAEAQALMPELFLAPHDPPADRRALEKLAEACERFTPCVALEEADEPQTLLLDISNLEHLHGSEAKLRDQIESYFTQRGYHLRIATAPTIGLAWALAHFEEVNGGLLPVEALRITSDTAALLCQLGIQTIDQLQALPREDLTSRFGAALLHRLDQFTGAAREALTPHRASAALKATCTLDEPTFDRATLAHVIRQLVEQLCSQLSARDHGAVILLCMLHVLGGTPGACGGRGEFAPTTSLPTPRERPPEDGRSGNVTLRIGLLEPSANPRQLMELIELHLENIRLLDEVNRIELQATVVGRLGERQGELFADRWPTNPHQLALLVNRLSSRLGHEQVLCAELRPSPVPERAVRYAPMAERTIKKWKTANCKLKTANHQRRAGKRTRPIENLQFAICNSQSAPRPLLLHPKPQPLEVVCVAPDGPPQFVWLDRRRQRIVHCAGPERIETLWWRGPSVRRDYYRIAAESGAHLWIFRRLTDARWFLHGTFA